MSQTIRTSRTTTRSSAATHAARQRSVQGRGDAVRSAHRILAGAILLLVGLGWAMALSLTPGGHDRTLVLSLLPWLLVVVGVALGVSGFASVSSSGRADRPRA